jgi:CBS domain containing-hemolysin-like protein
MAFFFFGLFVYALLVLSERALMSVTPHELNLLRTEGERSGAARRAWRLATGQLRASLAAVVLGRLLMLVLTLMLGVQALLLNARAGYWLHEVSLRLSCPPTVAWIGAGLLLAALVAWLFLLIQSLDFQRTGRMNAGRWLRRLGWFVSFWRVVFWPLLPRQDTGLYAIFDPPPSSKKDNPATPRTDNRNAGRDLELLKSIVQFSDVTIKQVMQPRSKIVGVDAAADFAEVLEVVRNAGFSRFPVFDGDLDNVTGVLYTKDLLAHLNESAGFEWQKLVRPTPMLVPEAQHASELLGRFKQRKRHIAVVVDEHGGTAGIVTMEDILEEVTGEIRDEFDVEHEEVLPYQQLDDRNYLFSGQAHLNDVCRIAGLAPDTFDTVRGDTDTIAGLVLALAKDIPAAGAEVRWGDYLLTVRAADHRRVAEVQLTLG